MKDKIFNIDETKSQNLHFVSHALSYLQKLSPALCDFDTQVWLSIISQLQQWQIQLSNIKDKAGETTWQKKQMKPSEEVLQKANQSLSLKLLGKR